tara:strand:+ start:190 stop:558 length:369 start_codon:yes stop_codon:yes gene_type:complete
MDYRKSAGLMSILSAHDHGQHLHGEPFFTEKTYLGEGRWKTEPSFGCPIDDFKVVSHEVKSYPKNGIYPAMEWISVKLYVKFNEPYWMNDTEATFELFIPLSFPIKQFTETVNSIDYQQPRW